MEHPGVNFCCWQQEAAGRHHSKKPRLCRLWGLPLWDCSLRFLTCERVLWVDASLEWGEDWLLPSYHMWQTHDTLLSSVDSKSPRPFPIPFLPPPLLSLLLMRLLAPSLSSISNSCLQREPGSQMCSSTCWHLWNQHLVASHSVVSLDILPKWYGLLNISDFLISISSLCF